MTDRVLAGIRAERAVDLRLAGLDYDTIAQRLGYANRSGSWKAVQRCLKERQRKKADLLVDQTLTDLGLLLECSWQGAVAGDLRSLTQCLRAMDQRARLLGLYREAI